MSCLCGSTKKQNAPSSFDTNNIGAFCVLFGLEGDLCRLLDLIPEATVKLFSFNFAEEDTLDLFEDILKLVGKKAFQLLIDEITGQIDTQSFCSKPPPPLPEPPTFQDVFKYIAEAVPLLGAFFQTADIVLGDNTNLLEKVVGFWLYEKWFEFCECRKCEEEDPPNFPPPYTAKCSSSQAEANTNALLRNLARQAKESKDAADFFNNNREDFDQVIQDAIANINARGDRFLRVEDLPIDPVNPPSVVTQNVIFENILINIRTIPSYSEVTRKTLVYYEDLTAQQIGIVSGEQSEFYSETFLTPSNVSPQVSENCPPPPIPEFTEQEEEEFKDGDEEPPFCALFPDDPLCVREDNECNYEDVLVTKFVSCGLKLPARFLLNNGGEPISTDVFVYQGCGEQPILENRQLLFCNPQNPPPPPEVFGCTNSNSFNYNPLATVDDGSCVDRRSGCTDPEAFNYDPLANEDDGGCIPVILGCTNDLAVNYNPNANTDDGSCEFG